MCGQCQEDECVFRGSLAIRDFSPSAISSPDCNRPAVLGCQCFGIHTGCIGGRERETLLAQVHC
jgi:hypothetical protein